MGSPGDGSRLHPIPGPRQATTAEDEPSLCLFNANLLAANTGLRNALQSLRRPWLVGAWPAGLSAPLRIPIDHVVHSSELVVTELQLATIFGSDHLPLLFELRPAE